VEKVSAGLRERGRRGEREGSEGRERGNGKRKKRKIEGDESS